MIPQSNYFQELTRRLWVGTLAVEAVLIAVTAIYWPNLTIFAVFGAMMGVFYLWSLIFSAQNPKRKIQFVFSLTRIVIFAYLVVKLTDGRLGEFTVVMSGLLGYKLILMVETARQSLPAFRKPKAKGAAGADEAPDTAQTVEPPLKAG